MKLNRKTDHAFRVLMFVALQNDQLTTIEDIANNFAIPRENLMKIISELAKLNYIISVKGRKGGVKLNPKTLDLPLAEVVKNFEPAYVLIDCFNPICPIAGNCYLSRIFKHAMESFLSTLGNYTLADTLPQTQQKLESMKKKLGIDIRVIEKKD